MSDLILYAILHSRQVGQYATHEDVQKAREDFTETAQATLAEMKRLLDAGYTILDSWNDSHSGYNIRQVLLHKPEDATVSAQNWRTEVLTGIEVKSTYSKTEQSSFDYLRCSFRQSKFVNIFDHPDESRNTWKFVKNRGWTWVEFQGAIMNSYPVPCTLTFDGEWFSLIDVIDKHEYDLLCEHIDSMNGANDNDHEEEA